MKSTMLINRWVILIPALLGVLLGSVKNVQAAFELRANYTYHWMDPKKLNEFMSGTSTTTVKRMDGMGFDARYVISQLHTGLGFRYEKRTRSVSSSRFPNIGNYAGETGVTRLAVLVNVRVLDSQVFLGPVGTLGVSDSAYFKHTVGTTGNYTSSKKTSISVGLEGGLKLKFFMIGLEGGYLFANYGVPKNGNSEYKTMGTNEPIPLVFTGPYAQVSVGITF